MERAAEVVTDSDRRGCDREALVVAIAAAMLEKQRERKVRGRALHVPESFVNVGTGCVDQHAESEPITGGLGEHARGVVIVAGTVEENAVAARHVEPADI